MSYPGVARRLVLLLLVAVASLAASQRPLLAQPVVSAVDAVAITVSDLDKAVEFYTKVLDFKPVSEIEVAGEAPERLLGVFGSRIRVARLALGEEQIELTEFLAPKGRPIPPDTRSHDQWFQHIAIVVSDMDKAYAHLRRFKVTHASPGPQVLPDWNPNAAGIAAFYFRDPDGHFLEVIHFPKGKGNPRWQGATDKLFLGIDHTAIVVADTDAALALYRDKLGMKLLGESENYGPEQERLNNVFGARLRITAVGAAKGPGVEFLEYLSPRDGRRLPEDGKANDLWHWHIVFSVPSVDAAAAAIKTGGYRYISPGIVTLPAGGLPYKKGLSARDPTGHALLFVEK